jgi:glyoxylase-like metal-dependent hydrolase (beta-lactamase superfamily II)
MYLTHQVDLLPNGGWDERILLVRNGTLVTVAILVTTRFVVIFDTLFNPTTARALLEIALGHCNHTPRQLLVVNSHADWDHAWGNGVFAGPGAHRPAPIIAHAQAAARLTHPDSAAELRALQAAHPGYFDEVVLTPPTLTFTGDFTIDGGDLTLHLLATPGHTPDHLALYIPELETLLAADAAELPYPAPATVAGLPTLRASLARLATLRPVHALYCHAPIDAGPALIQTNIAYFDALEAACRAALARGIDPAHLATHDDATLIALLDCPYEKVTPQGGAWAEVEFAYRTPAHAAQLRRMLAWLASSNRG